MRMMMMIVVDVSQFFVMVLWDFDCVKEILMMNDVDRMMI
jgi:hypothetical protein